MELRVLYLSGSQADREWAADGLASFEEVLPGFHWCADRSAGYYNHVNPALFRRLSPGRVDVAVFGAYYVASMWLGMYWCRLRGIPYLMQCESHGRRERSGWRVRAKDALIGPLVRNAAGWLPLGSLARDYLVDWGASPERCRFCPNTPDVEAMVRSVEALPARPSLRAEWGLPTDRPVLLYVGRFIDIKRVDLLLDAYAGLRAGGTDAVLALAGGGLREEALRQRVRDESIPDVQFLGFVQPDRLPGLYAAADLLALPSDDEPWAVVVNEAMACGTPVVASDRVGAAADLIVAGETGATFPAGDAAALREALAAGLSLDRAAASAACRTMAMAWGYDRCRESMVELASRACGRPWPPDGGA
ncbi:MAG: glycosyltransferase family 4 protein [Planctomycetota bacterium]